MSGGNAKDDRHPYRVHVSGLAKGVVQRQDGHQCYDEEYQVGDFFYNRGCDVVWVSLLVDKRSSRSRGFAFVDFEDEASFRRACELNGTENPPEVKLDEKGGGKIQVSPAKPSEDSTRERHLELTKERDRTDGLEKDMRLCAARINEKMEQIQTQRDRQMALQRTAKVDEELHNQRARQQQIKELMAELDAMETSLTKELHAEKERTKALEELHASVSWEEAPHDELAHAAPHDEPLHEGGGRGRGARPVKPRIAPEAESLHRSISVASGREEPRAASPPSPVERAPSRRPWLAKRDEKEEVLQRAASRGHGDISRNILDGKIQALEMASSTDRGRGSADTNVGPKKMPAHPRWGEIEDDEDQATSDAHTAATVIWGRGGGRRDVLVKKMPLLPDEDLKHGLEEELTRLWEAMGRPSPPRIESVEVVPKQETYAAKSTGTEATITFADPYDAWLLVEKCGAPDWSSSATPSLHGRLLQIEWPPMPPQVPDFRKFAFRADSDASSQLTYHTMGTAVSRSSMVAKTAAVARSGTADSSKSGDFVPLQNRTVILSGVPPNLKIYDVQKEVLSLLQRLYQKNGYVFNQEAHLHKGRQGLEAGLEVRPAMNRQDENGGTVKLRLRNYADAVWLVEQASGLKIAGSKLKASWANVRCTKETGKGDGKGPVPTSRKGDGKGVAKTIGRGGY